MISVIKGQIVVLASILIAFALTLAACGGGSSSSGGGAGSTNLASVSGTVTNNGIASLDGQGSLSLLAEVSSAFIPTAHAAAVSSVTIILDCGDGAIYDGKTDAEGKYKIMVSNVGTGLCSSSFNGSPGPQVKMAEGKDTQMDVILNGNSVTLVKMDQNSEDSASVDDVSSADSSSDDASDDVSDNDSDSDSDSDSA